MRAEALDRRGLVCGVVAFGMWGLVPIYFKAVTHVPALEVLCHRVIWSVVLLALIVHRRGLWSEVRIALRSGKTLGVLLLTTLLIANNWFIFIWAVNTNRVLDASLGYFINPLVNILLGVVLLRERLSRAATLSVALATLGVTYQVAHGEGVPWIALVLAFSFGLYGLLRKTARVGSVVGLGLETALLAPVALVYLEWLRRHGTGGFGGGDSTTDILLIAAGVVTAIPLIFFTSAARRLPLSTMGFLQYLAPTGQFLLAVLAYGEPLTIDHLITFGCIWLALGVFTWDMRRARGSGACSA